MLTLIYYHNSVYDTIGAVIRMFKINKTEYENKSLRLPKDLIKKVQSLADANELSFNRVVIQCIEYALANIEDESIK